MKYRLYIQCHVNVFSTSKIPHFPQKCLSHLSEFISYFHVHLNQFVLVGVFWYNLLTKRGMGYRHYQYMSMNCDNIHVWGWNALKVEKMRACHDILNKSFIFLLWLTRLAGLSCLLYPPQTKFPGYKVILMSVRWFVRSFIRSFLRSFLRPSVPPSLPISKRLLL